MISDSGPCVIFDDFLYLMKFGVYEIFNHDDHGDDGDDDLS